MARVSPPPREAGNDRPGLWFGILGPLMVRRNGQVLAPGPQKRQLVLAALLCHANCLVDVDSLIDALWESNPPRTARKNLQVYVCSLRGQLPADPANPRIVHQGGGYLLRAGSGELDALAFERMASAAYRLDRNPEATARQLGQALELWRGPILAGLSAVPLINTAIRRFEGQLLTVFEEWAEAQVAAGGAIDAIERISTLAREHPLRERLRLVQMAALSQLGRRTEALAVYDELRQLLARELGLSPGAALARFHESLLRGESTGTPPGGRSRARPGRWPGRHGADPGMPGRGQRRDLARRRQRRAGSGL